MSKIAVAIIDTHNLLMEGLRTMLDPIEDMEVLITTNDMNFFLKECEQQTIHVLIKNLNKITPQDIEDVERALHIMPKLKVLIISFSEDEDTIYKIIKAGAKGFLTNDATRQDLIEAVYSLRNGFDYFSKCITNILLNKYINIIQSKPNIEDKQLAKLSTREIEILKMWGSSCSNKDIADKLFISIRTVESHKTHIMQKLNLKTSVDLIKYAIKNNIIEL